MIKVHHLNNSRSQRILWLLEELELDYEVLRYERDGTTNLAPPELEAVHPLGKSPVIEDAGLKLHESGAIVEYVIRTYGEGRLAPDIGTADYAHYVEWLHYAEGSAMLPLLMRLYSQRLGATSDMMEARINGETINHFSFMNNHMADREFFVGNDLTGADIMMSFPLEAAGARGGLDILPNLSGFVRRIQERPAYLRALEKGGEYAFGPASS